MKTRTLKAIRQDAPASDRQDAALTPTQPEWARALGGSRYVRVSIYPQTRDELRKLGHEYGEAVVRELDWSCVIVWLMNGPEEVDLSNPLGVAITAVNLCRGGDNVRNALPTHDGSDWPPPALDYLSTEMRDVAVQIAAETLADWRKAGSPYFGLTRLKQSYQRLVSCPAFAKYVRPLAANENKETA